MPGKKGMKKASAEAIAQARALRKQGLTYDQIRQDTGIGLSSLNRYLSDIPKPVAPRKKQKQTLAAYDRRMKRQAMKDHATPMHTDDDDSVHDSWLPDQLPIVPDGFDTNGLFPDNKLVAWADRVQQHFLEARARGVIFHETPIEAIKALTITSTTLRPWDDEWLREHRNQWTAIRHFTSLNSATVAERAGISASSLTRYANNTRTPLRSDFEKIGEVLWAAMQDRLYQLDLHLCLHDYAQAHDLDTEDEYDLDEALRWIAAVGPDDEHSDAEVTIDHLPSLAHVRSLQPIPEYRDEDTILFGYTGFTVPDEPLLEEVDEDEAA